jgi:IS5 family transposase
VIVDGAPGLEKAIAAVRDGVPVQRCSLPGNPYDGHTLGGVIAATEHSPAALSSAPTWVRAIVGTTPEHPRRVFISGQKRGVFGSIKRELRRRSAIETASAT